MTRGMLVVAFVALMASCVSDDTVSDGTANPITVVPDSTVPAPGSCTPSPDDPDVPRIVVDGETTEATLGTSSDPCDAITGTGYLDFNYNPVLIDASGPIRVEVGDAKAALSWSLGEPFTETRSGTWESADPEKGCARLTIDLESAAGGATATYGADIRVGGGDVECAQRSIDATEIGSSGDAPPSTRSSQTSDSTDTTESAPSTT